MNCPRCANFSCAEHDILQCSNTLVTPLLSPIQNPTSILMQDTLWIHTMWADQSFPPISWDSAASLDVERMTYPECACTHRNPLTYWSLCNLFLCRLVPSVLVSSLCVHVLAKASHHTHVPGGGITWQKIGVWAKVHDATFLTPTPNMSNW